jgi:hypothetical protein
MSIMLCRIDDRLIHGQVVVGWGRPMGINLIILVDDQVAASEWEQELYRMAVAPDIEVRFVSVAGNGAWSSPAISRPWPRSTPRARRSCIALTWAASITDPAAASDFRLYTSPIRSLAS